MSVEQYLILLLKCVINEQPIPPLPPEVSLQKLYEFSRFHLVHNVAYYGIEKLNLPKTELLDKWRKERDLMLVKDIVQQTETESICKAFSAVGIRLLSFKGRSLKALYPQQDMRISSDVDLLIDASNRKQATDVMLSLEYEHHSSDEIQPDVFYKRPMMNVELHRNMFSEPPFDKCFLDVWDNAVEERRCYYRLSDEEEYVYSLAHFYKHYTASGCGIRFITDLYLQNKKLTGIDRDKVNKRLSELSLTDFLQQMSEIAEKWFDRGDVTAFSKQESFILYSGAYGSSKSAVETEFSEIEGKGALKRLRYYRQRMFPSLEMTSPRYPVLYKAPYLLPAIWIVRFFQTIFCKNTRIKNELKTVREKSKGK